MPSGHILTLYRIALGHIEHIPGTDRKCPLEKINSSQNDAPNFLTSLTNTESLTSEQIVGLVTDLFTAGIDSVSIQTLAQVTFTTPLFSLRKKKERKIKRLKERKKERKKKERNRETNKER